MGRANRRGNVAPDVPLPVKKARVSRKKSTALTYSQIVNELEQLEEASDSYLPLPNLILIDPTNPEVGTTTKRNVEEVTPVVQENITSSMDSTQREEIGELQIGHEDSVIGTDDPDDKRQDPDYNEASEILPLSEDDEVALISKNSNKDSKKNLKGGRPKDNNVWESFTVIKDMKKKKATCKKCGTIFDWPKVERLRSHLALCLRGNGSQALQQGIGVFDSPLTTSVTANLTPRFENQATTNPKISQPMILDAFRGTEKFKKKADHQIAKFFFACNIPFAVADHPEFIAMIRMLHPSHKPPSSKTISGPLLDNVYDEIVDKAKEAAAGKFATLMQDGWTGIQQAPVISHCINVEGSTSIFVNAIATTNDVKDAGYCAKLATDAIKEAEEKFQCRIGALVSDNCSTMVLMRTMVSHSSDLWTYGCHTHWLNLVGKEVAPSDVIDQVKSVQRFFRDVTYPRETLRKLGGLQTVLPCETRWNTQFLCLENFIKNHSIYLDIAKNPTANTPQEVSKILTNLRFYQRVKDTMNKMGPVKDAIEKLQHDKATVSDAVHHWIKIKRVCGLEDIPNCKFNDRMDKALPAVVCAAYLLDPYYRGADLPDKFRESGHAWLADKNSLYVSAQFKLAAGDSNYYIKRLMNKELLRGELPLTATQWWDLMGSQMGSKLPFGLPKLAKELMMLPASTSSMERCFSTMGSIMSKTRNRLAVEKASKLCMTYRTLNSQRLRDEDINMSE